MGEDDIATITRAFGQFAQIDTLELAKPEEVKSNRGRQSANPKAPEPKTFSSKIFATTDFGYRRITVERPLRLGFQTTPERIERVLEEKAMQKLDDDARVRLLAALQSMDAGIVHRNREQFAKLLKKTLAGQSISLSTAEQKAVMNALSERDPEADICMTKGQPEPDSGLRDNENVPLGESIYDYFEREVKPHVPDAWIDESKTKIGYEIPLNRHFYQYEPPRPLEVIEADIKALEREILDLLGQVTGSSEVTP
jgi:type I restriction enzyme M protein